MVEIRKLGRPTESTSPGMRWPERIVFRQNADRDLAAQTAQQAEKIEAGGDVGEHGRHGGALDLHTEHEDEQGIECDIQNSTEGDAETGLTGVALRADQMRECGIENGRRGAEADCPEKVPAREIMRLLVCAQNGQQRRQKQQHQQAVGRSDPGGAPETEGRAVPGLFAVADAETAGDQTGSADAEEIGKSGQKDEQGHGDGRGGHLIRVAELADEKGIRHVVNDGDDLTEDRRDGQRENGSSDRDTCKQRFLFCAWLLQSGPPLF